MKALQTALRLSRQRSSLNCHSDNADNPPMTAPMTGTTTVVTPIQSASVRFLGRSFISISRSQFYQTTIFFSVIQAISLLFFVRDYYATISISPVFSVPSVAKLFSEIRGS